MNELNQLGVEGFLKHFVLMLLAVTQQMSFENIHSTFRKGTLRYFYVLIRVMLDAASGHRSEEILYFNVRKSLTFGLNERLSLDPP